MSSSAFKAYEKCILQHPRMALTFVLAIAVTMAIGLQHFKIDASADALTLELDEDLNYYRELVSRYGTSNYLVVTYNPKDENLFDDKVLVHLHSLIDDLVAVPGVTGSLSILDVPLLYSPKISVADFSDELSTLLTPGVNRSLAKQEFLDSPIYKNTILSSDGQTTGIMLNLELDQLYLSLVKTRDTLRQRRTERPLTDEESEELDRISKEFLDHRTDQTLKNQRLIAEIRAVTSAYKDKATIFLGGPDMITVDMVDFLKSDLIVFGNGILIFIIFTLVLIFRRIHWVVLPLINCAACIVIMLGFFSWIDWRLTVISSNFVSLLMIVTLALTIHLIVRYRELSSQKPKAEQIQLVRETVSSMTRPCLYTVLTTAVAFASLVVSNIRPVIDFGWMMTLGIFVALAISFIVIPAGMMLIGRKPDKHHEDSVSITRVFAAFTERYGNVVLGASLILAGLATFGISQLEVENRFIDYFHSDTEIYRGMETIDTSLGGTTPLDIVIQAPSQGIVSDSNDIHNSLDVSGDDASSDWKTYNGTSGDLTNGLIAPFQGFWIQALGGVGSMTIQTDDIATSSTSFIRNINRQNNFISLSVFNENKFDNIYFTFDSTSSEGYDTKDAIKLVPLSKSARVAAMIINDNKTFKINSLPSNYDSTMIFPLQILSLGLDSVGNYIGIKDSLSLSFNEINIPENINVYILDNISGYEHSIHDVEELSIITDSIGVIDLESITPVSRYLNYGNHRYFISFQNTMLSNNYNQLVPKSYQLFQNYPNPFNPETNIMYNLPKRQFVNITIYDMLGHEVRTLVNQIQEGGLNNIRWLGLNNNSEKLSSGVYLYSITTENFKKTKKMLLLK